MTLPRIVCIRRRAVACTMFRRPLVRPRWALGQFPFEAKQVVEEVVTPLSRCLRPNDFQTAADGVSTRTFSKLILPPEALVLNVGTFWFSPHVVSGNGSAVGFAECMSAGDQCDCFFVVHSHALERFANVPGRCDRIRLSIGPFRVHVNQAHLNRAKRTLQITIAAVALVRKPRAFRPPIHLFGLPYIRTSATETKCLEAHRFKGDVAGENHQGSTPD